MPNIESVMTRDPAICTPDDGVVECARTMARRDVGFIPVVESLDTRRLIGVVTDRDLCLGVIAEERDPKECRVEEVMTENPVCVTTGDTFEHVLELMRDHQIRRMCVIDENRACIGVIAQADVVRAAGAKEVKETVREISRPASD